MRRRSTASESALSDGSITVELIGAALRCLRQTHALAQFPTLVTLARGVLAGQDDDPGRLVHALLLRAITAVGQSSARVVQRGPDYLQAILSEVYVEGRAQKEVFPRHDVPSDATFSRHLQRAVAAAAGYLQGLEQSYRPVGKDAGRLEGEGPGRSDAAALRLPLTSFVDRERELAVLAEYLIADGSVGRPPCLITLTGPAGVGKSRLAVEAAHAARAAFEQVWFVSLAAVTDPNAVPAEIAISLPIDRDPKLDPVEKLRQFVAGRRVLLVLDNFDRLRPAAADMIDLLLACPRLVLLVTSREALRVEGEHLVRVPPLTVDGPARGSGAKADPAAVAQEAVGQPAVQLFADRARAADAHFTVDARNAAGVLELCRRLDGLPLAIEIVAANVASRSLLAGAAPDRLLTLKLPHRPQPPWHISLQQAIGWSYDVLPPAAQRLFRCCSLFGGAFDPAAAAAVRGEPQPDTVAVAGMLGALADQHLLERRADGGQDVRYALLSTVRQYARVRLREQREEMEAVRSRYTAYYLELARKAEANLFGPAQVATLALLEQELDNLRVVLRHAAAGSTRAAGLELVGSLWMFWSLRGHVGEGREWLNRLLPPPAGQYRIPATVSAKAHFCAGFLAAFDAADAARAHFEQARDLYRRLGDQRWESWCLLGLGQLALERRTYLTARSLLLEALGMFQAVGDRPGTGWALSNLGRLAQLRGKAELARQRLAEGGAVWEQVGGAWGRSTCLGFLANLEYLVGRYADAVRHYEQSVQLFADLGHHLARAWRLLALGDVLRLMGDDQAARTKYEASLRLFQQQNEPNGIAWALHNLAYPALDAGDLPQATDLLRRSLAIFRERRHEPGIAACLVGLAGVALASGDPAMASRLLGAADLLLQTGIRLEPADRAEYQRIVTATRAALVSEEWERRHSADMSLDELFQTTLQSSQGIVQAFPGEDEES